MPRIDPELQRLKEVRTFTSLIKYLKDELNWPIPAGEADDVSFDYDPAELGFNSDATAKIDEVKQLRPLDSNQKWGIFWVKFGKKKLPVQMLRRALGNLVIKKRASTKKGDLGDWKMHDLLFISAYGDDTNRHITFAHFSESEDSEKSLPVLKVLGWDDDDTILHLQDTYKTLVSTLNWDNTPVDDLDAWREHWASAFKVGHREVINTTKELVVELAHLATVIKKSVLTSINAETEKGPWKKLMLAFQKTLIKDLNEEQFADVIAQTISYGLLTARLSSDGQISLKNLVDMVPSTNPFLKELLQHFLTSAGMKGLFDVDEAGINDVVELLNRANAQAIRNDFGKKTDGEDPVIHFYEHFLGAYNKKLKVERGVFYTPKPIVSYIVRSVHELLQKEFGLEDGLADTSTWAEVEERHKDLKIPEGIKPDIEPFVQILDPATGTATFLIEVIDVIHNTMTAKWDKERVSKAEQIKKWNTYVPTHLLPRLYAYELMMAPYAIAHMKVGLKLAETGFTAWEKLGPENRANIFLTNALEPWEKQLQLIGFDALAHEAAAVNEVKRHKSFTVVIGNPPYSNFGQLNKIPFILSLLEDYKRGLDEKKFNMTDDFIKFVKLAQHTIDGTSVGVVGMITNNVFIDGLTHRRMRQSLIESFPACFTIDLHGSVKKQDSALDGSKDENVFDIQQGVAISLWAKNLEQPKYVRHCSYRGTRDSKYKALSNGGVSTGNWTRVEAESPQFFFCPNRLGSHSEYLTWIGLKEIFSVGAGGLESMKDDLAVSFSKTDLTQVVRDLHELPLSKFRADYKVEDSAGWRLEAARSDIRSHKKPAELLRQINYRPFDIRWTFYSGNQGFMSRPRFDLFRHLIHPNNIGLCAMRQSRAGEEPAFFAIRGLAGKDIVSALDRGTVFPLFLENESSDEQSLLPGEKLNANFSAAFIRRLSEGIQQGASTRRLPDGLTPENIFHYAYAVFHSPGYRTRYAEFLKIDFPRLPLTGSLELFRTLARLGGELTSLHLLESPNLAQPITDFIGGRNPEVEKISWTRNTVWVDKAQATGFQGVREDVWNFHIGGYQVCEKWLKDRKGRKLTKDDIEHYHKIVVALSETMRLMAEIDKVIDEHGGWPGAFQAAK